MKTRLIKGAAALLMGLAFTAALAQQSIDSKLEQMGAMTHVRIKGLKQVVRDGRMSVQVELYNEEARNQVVFWRVRWLDEAGIQVWDDEPWKQELVYGNQRRVLLSVAPTTKAADFRIELQSPENKLQGSDSNSFNPSAPPNI